MKLFFDDNGEGDPIVLIHAFPLSREMWKLQTGTLLKKGFRVILPDLPGFGENNLTHRFSIHEMALQIAELLEFLKINKAIIGGLSMGGYVSFNLFRLISEKISALILCDTTHLADNEKKINTRLSLISKIENEGSSALVENMLPNLISDYTKKNNHFLTEYLDGILSKINPESAMNALRSMAERQDSSDVLNQISIPTLLIFGEFDKVTNPENAKQMKQNIDNAELAIIENAGHFSNLENRNNLMKFY